MIAKVQNFITEVTVELKKVSWSTRAELLEATKVVLVSALLLGVFIASIDFVLSKILSVIIR